MSSYQRIYLDTNIFIALAEGQGEERHALLEIIGAQKPDEPLFLCTSELALAELLILPYRERNEGLIQLYDNWILQGNTWLDVGPVSREVLWYAALVRQQYPKVKLPDAIHISTAIGFGCSHFLTADTGIPNPLQITNIRWNVTRNSSPLTVIRPHADVLGEILKSRTIP